MSLEANYNALKVEKLEGQNVKYTIYKEVGKIEEEISYNKK